MSDLRERTQEINAEYWASRETQTERVVVAQFAIAFARAELETAEAAAAARAALLDEMEAAVEGWRSVDHGLFSGAVVDGWLVHRGAVLREIKKLKRP